MRNRFKLMAAALLLLPIINACGGDLPPPPPTGSISGLVSIEGQGADGISVTLSNGGSATTANGGMYRFDDLEAGTYTVTISNFPDEASFDQTSAPATIAIDGETVTVNFSGTYIRTSSIMGTVTVEDDGLAGITVSLSGVSDSETLTDASGQYAFTGLRAGNYTVEITGFDDEDVAFGSTSSAATVAVGESKVVSFEGTYLRTSGVMGQITADDQPQEGITVSLQGRGEDRSVTTNSAGQYSFDALRRGDYAVGISGYDTDEVSFDETSKSVTVAYGETANIPFEGTLLRTAGIEGTVTVEGVGPISGVTVTISGEGESADDVTDNAGGYSFEGLPAGDYSVVISGFDDDEYGFPDGTSATVTVELKETGTVPFEGIMLRTAAIEGTVTVGDNDAPLRGVTVTIEGGPKDEEHETTTNGSGKYQFDRLHAGDYSVSISGYDTREYGFDPTTKTVTVGLRDTGEAAFQGDLLRTAGISGRVHVGGAGMGGITVTLTGAESREGNTDADGQYGFSGLAAGDYTLTISGWDQVEYAFDPTMDISLELDESMTGVNFEGKALRTATVMGSVTVEGAGLPGIAVTLIKVESANSGTVIETMATGSDGGYTFGPLLAGAYQVRIAGYADEHDFGEAGTTRTTVVAVDGMAEVNFEATIIRTAGVSGMVTLDGEGMADIAVTLTGDHAPDDNSMTTGADGAYSFGELRKGNYTVTMTNPDEGKYSFPTTSRSMNLSVGQKQTGISFAGASLRRASISGRVQTENDDAVPGVTVTLSGKADGTETTNANGEYNFPGLAGGTYVVEISGWDSTAYEFPSDSTRKVRDLGDDQGLELDFIGTHTKTASIGGVLFIDEVTRNLMRDGDLEPMLNLGGWPEDSDGFPITLEGPDIDSPPTPGFATSGGRYEFANLRAGKYVVSVDVKAVAIAKKSDTVTVEEVLGDTLGYEYTGAGRTAVSVAAGEPKADINLPFKIITQTINVAAVMGDPDTTTTTKVGGVELVLYPTAKDADRNTNPLGTAKTGNDDKKPDDYGIATFEFARSDDKGPGRSATTDHLVFAKVVDEGDDDLLFSDNRHVEIQYDPVRRESDADAKAKLANVRVDFLWKVRSNKDARGGNQLLGGWKTVMGKGDDATTHVTADSTDTKVDAEDHGIGMFGERLTLAQAIAGKSYTIDLDEDVFDANGKKTYDAKQTAAMDEDWDQSTALKRDHDHLALPGDTTDIGTIYVTWETQKLTVGVYREVDDEEGYTDYRGPGGGAPSGDQRPHAEVADEMMIELLYRDSRNRLRRYEWDPDPETGKFRKKGYREVGPDGMVTFLGIPAGEELTVAFHPGDGRTQMDYGYDEIETFGSDLTDTRYPGMTLGAFGDKSGGRHEVRMCSASDRMSKDATGSECATFAYQWKTAMVYGKVGFEKGHEVEVEPETTGHGARGGEDTTDGDVESTEDDEGGDYSISGLQDGVYTATATASGKFSIVEPSARKGIVLFHNEKCWAATNPKPATGDEPPSDCEDDEVVAGTDDGNTTWSYANRHPETWTTRRSGQAIKGYIANDGQDGENADGLLRGDESMAGIPVTLKQGTKTISTTKTNAEGLYEFPNLDAGRYTVSAGKVSNAMAIHAINKHPTTDRWRVVTTKAATPQDYPTEDFSNDATVDKPTWNREISATGRTMGNGTSVVKGPDDDSTDDDATLYNFALVYTDGTASGRVENLSAKDDGDIDVLLESPIPTERGREVKTRSPSGVFEIGGLMEAIGYKVTLEDGYEIPCLDADNEPDDEARNADGTCTAPATLAPDSLIGDIEGEADGENFGILYVYNSNRSANDDLDSLKVKGFRDTDLADTTLAALTTTPSQDAGGTTAITVASVAGADLTAIPFEDGKIDISVFGHDDATIKVGAESDGFGESCEDMTCTLGYNRTGATSADAETTITVTVTAPNGYDDHDYTFTATRSDPEGYTLDGLTVEAAGETDVDVFGGGPDDGTDNTWSATMDAATVELVFNFATVDYPSGHDRADEAAWCQKATVTDGGKKLRAEPKERDDECEGMRFEVDMPAAGAAKTVQLTIESQDGQKRDVSLTLERPTS